MAAHGHGAAPAPPAARRQLPPCALMFLLVLLCSAVLLALFYRPTAFFGSGDGDFTLLTARAILQEGTIKLDMYKEEFARHGIQLHPRYYTLVEKNGHLYGFLPLGYSILSLPLVVVYNALGIETMDLRSRSDAQSFAAALTCVWVFVMLYLLARRYLYRSAALPTALVFLLGSAFASTMGSSLWTHNFVAPLTLTVLYLLVRMQQGAPLRYGGVLIGVLLFLAYLCRPTAVLLAPVVFVVLYLLDKPAAYKAVASSVLLGLLFIGFSYYEFGQWLPEYYLGGRLGSADFWLALYGNLLSPSRGLLIFTPVVLLLAFPVGGWRKALAGQKVLLLFLLWPVAHLLAISSFPRWWGGHCYGPRLMVDVLPVVYLFLLLYMKQLLAAPGGLARSVHAALLGLLAAVSITMHTYQGLYNRAQIAWNGAPNVDQHPELLFDWKYPQFLHTHERQQRRDEEYRELMTSPEHIKRYHPPRPK